MQALRRRAPLLLAGAALVAVAGCGEDEESKPEASSDKPAALTIEASGSGKSLKLTAPKTVPAGTTTITLKNGSDSPRSLQLIRVDEGHEAQEGLAAGNAWGSDGKPLPEWAHAAGGVPMTPPAQSGTSTQQLPPGKYAAVDLDAEPPPTTFFEVTGESSDGALPEAPARVELNEYSFQPTGLTAGRQRVVIDNKGAEPHFVAAAPIKDGKTIDDVRKYVETEKGEPPIDEEQAVATPVLDGKTSQVVDLELKSGNYALLCWVPDRKGGPPHAVKGMISAATVE